MLYLAGISLIVKVPMLHKPPRTYAFKFVGKYLDSIVVTAAVGEGNFQ
jgi:hypothetical protein